MDVNLYVDSNNGDFTLTADGSVITDKTLTKSGMAADSKATGDAINAEKVARESADADLQLQINQIITPGGAPSEAEIANARIGADGTVYDNLGDAIRTQVFSLDSSIDAVTEEILGGNVLWLPDFSKKRGTLTTAIDSVNGTIDISITSTTTYAGLSTSSGYAQSVLTPGKKYRLHAKAEATSGTPYMAFALRGVQGNPDGIYAAVDLNADNEQSVDFVATEYNSHFTLFISFDSSKKNTSVRYSNVWVEELIGDSAIDISARNTAKLTNKFNIPNCLWWGRQNYSIANGYTNLIFASSTISLKLKEPVRLYTDNSNILFFAVYPDSGNWSGFLQDVTIPGNTEFVLIAFAKDQSSFVASYLEDIYIYTTESGYEEFRDKYFYKITESFRFRSTTSIYFDGNLWSDSNMIGCRKPHTETYFKASSRVLFADVPVTIFVTKYQNSSVNVIVNGVIVATIAQGKSYTVPENTEFTIAISGSQTNTTNDYGWNVILVPPADTTSGKINYALLWNDSNYVTRADCSFIDSTGALYNIDRSGPEYTVYVDNVLVKTESLSGSVGHANNCNYRNGNVYISSWSDDNTLIYVYAVNEVSQTLTYSKTITIPLTADFGATEYYILDDEKQIISFSMTANYDAMIVSIWTKAGSSYVESNRQYLPMETDQAEWIQGFTYYNDRIYYVMGKIDYMHLATGVFNIKTGLVEKLVTSDDLSSVEIQGIIPLINDIFLLVSGHGNLFLQNIN